MKRFDIEAALAGTPVRTRDGRSVTQIHVFDVDTLYPVYGVLGSKVYTWTMEGRHTIDASAPPVSKDPFGQVPIKREGWVEACDGSDDPLDLFLNVTVREGWVLHYPNQSRVGSNVFETEEQAIAFSAHSGAIAIRIEWEE